MFIYNEKFVSKKEGYYYSCPWIEHGLVFFPYKLTMCCNCGHEGGGHVMVSDNFSGKNFDINRIFKVKEIYRRFHKKGKINVNCMNCNYLKEEKWNNENYLDHLYISHWTKCNSKCIYCYESNFPEDFKNKNLYEVLPILKNLYEQGLLKREANIAFGGGEPTLLGEFDDIIKFFMDNYFIRFRVHTSGIKYSETLAQAINALIAYVVVSIDAGTKETYEKIKQVPCYEKVRDNVRKYALNTTFLGRDLISTKFVIIPGINDTKEEIEKWLQGNREDGLYASVLDIEENWYLENRYKIPNHIYKLIEYTEKRSKQLNTYFQTYERLQNLLCDKQNKKSSFFRKKGLNKCLF